MTSSQVSTHMMRETWEKFKRIETHSEADIDQLMALVSDSPTMTNPLMKAEGRDEVRNFLLADITWSKPIYYWEVIENDRVAMKWSQYPLQNTKPDPKPLFSCATWSFDSAGLLQHYYATWCKVECYEVMLDAGIELDPEFFVGKRVAEIIRGNAG